MTTPADATLAQRAGYLYRHLLLLRRLFPASDEDESIDAMSDGPEGLAVLAAVRDVIDELTEQAKILTAVPFPLKEWRPGDGADDERWRALTELERREVLSLVTGYENLLAWAETHTAERPRPAARGESRTGEIVDASRWTREPADPEEFLRTERARLAQFRRDMRFLDRRRIVDDRAEELPEPYARRSVI